MINQKIKTKRELSDILGVEYPKLTYVLYAKRIVNCYSSFSIPKRDGTLREISAPDSDLKPIQKALAIFLQEHRNTFKNKTISHGFESNRNIITNSVKHRNKKIVINIDIENFFGSFHFGRVKGYFEKSKKFQLSSEVATTIAHIACYKDGLPQGSPCSPIITNYICEILDNDLLKLTRKYKLSYTRYADDLTFSTNDMNFSTNKDQFIEEANSIIENFGLRVNHKKTKISYNNSRQEVTGLVVNEKVNVKKEYVKETRAMADSLYKKGWFSIGGKEALFKQLEGRFSFINSLDLYNYNIEKTKGKKTGGANKRDFKWNYREMEYQKFLFYKNFVNSENLIIITEGETDVLYMKAAIKNLRHEFPNLCSVEKGKFKYRVTFINRDKKMKYFFKLHNTGADPLSSFYRTYFYDEKTGKKDTLNNFFVKHRGVNNLPRIFFLFDNEQVKGKPLEKIKNNLSIKEEINMSKNINNNVYLLTHQLLEGKKESEIEDLFKKETLEVKIDGKTFSRKKTINQETEYSKTVFSKYILDNYDKTNFEGFKMLLKELSDHMEDYERKKTAIID